MKKNVAKFIARTKILSRVNMCDGSREARDELCRISDKYETTSSLKRETEYAKAYHYVILEVTVTDAKWLKGLEANLVFCSTAYDVWSDDPLFPKAPPGTPWAFKGKPKPKAKSGYLDEAFKAALDHRDSKAARALVKNIDPEARYLIRDDVHDDFDLASQMMGFARKPVIETTAFLYALKSGCDDIAFELLKQGADPLAVDGNGSTALFLTSEEKTFTKLVKTGIDINAKNLGGRTVLHVATLWGWTEIADLAIEHGADTTLKDKGGKTPADLAKQSSNEMYDLFDPPTLVNRLALVSKNLLGGDDVPAVIAALWKEQVSTGHSALRTIDALDLVAFEDALPVELLANRDAKKYKRQLHWFAQGHSGMYGLYRADKKASLDNAVVVKVCSNGDLCGCGPTLEAFIALLADETKTIPAAKKWFKANKLEWPDLGIAKEARRTQPTPGFKGGPGVQTRV
jgi:hypothetical protein